MSEREKRQPFVRPFSWWRDRYLLFSIVLLSAFLALPVTTANFALGACITAFLIHDHFKNFTAGVKGNNLLAIVSLYFIVIVITATREPDLTKTLDVITKRVLIILPLFFFGLKISFDDQKRILSAYVLSVTVACLMSFFKTVMKLDEITSVYEFSWHLSNNSVFSSNYLAVYTAFAIVVVFYSFLGNSLFTRWIGIGVLLILLAYITILGSRTAFFSMMLICCGYLILSSVKNRKHFLYAMLLMTALMVLMFTIPYFKSRVLVLFTVGFEADARYYEYQAAKEIIVENLLIGVGYSGSDYSFVKEYQRIGFHEGVENSYNAHNQFIQSAVLYGVGGLLIMVALYAAMLIRAIRLRSFLAIAFATLFTLCSFTECLLERNKGLLFFGFFAGLLLVADPKPKPTIRSGLV